MTKQTTLAEVDQAEAALPRKKKAASKRGADRGAYDKAAAELRALRESYRLQEEAAGRRTGLVATNDEDGA